MKTFKAACIVAAATMLLWGCGGQVTTTPPAGPEGTAVVTMTFTADSARDAVAPGVSKDASGYGQSGMEPGGVGGVQNEFVEVICDMTFGHAERTGNVLTSTGIEIRDLDDSLGAACANPSKCVTCQRIYQKWNETLMAFEPDPSQSHCWGRCNGIIPANMASQLDTFDVFSHFNVTVKTELLDLSLAAILYQGFVQDWAELDFDDVLDQPGPFVQVSPAVDSMGFDFLTDPFFDDYGLLTKDAIDTFTGTWTRGINLANLDPTPEGIQGSGTFHAQHAAPMAFTGATSGAVNLQAGPLDVAVTLCDDVNSCSALIGVLSLQGDMFENGMTGEALLGDGLDSQGVSINLTEKLNLGETIESVSASALNLSTSENVAVNTYLSDNNSAAIHAIVQDAYAHQNSEILLQENILTSANKLITGSTVLSLGASVSHTLDASQDSGYGTLGDEDVLSHFNYNLNDIAVYDEIGIGYIVTDYLAFAPTAQADTLAEAANFAALNSGTTRITFNDTAKALEDQVQINISQQVVQSKDYTISAGLYTRDVDNTMNASDLENWNFDNLAIGYCVHVPLEITGSPPYDRGETYCAYVGKGVMVLLDELENPVPTLGLYGISIKTAVDSQSGLIETTLTGGAWIPAINASTTQVRLVRDDAGLRAEYLNLDGSWRDISGRDESPIGFGSSLVLDAWDAGWLDPPTDSYGYTQVVYMSSTASAPGDFVGQVIGPYRNIGFRQTSDPSSGFPDMPDEDLVNIMETFIFRIIGGV